MPSTSEQSRRRGHGSSNGSRVCPRASGHGHFCAEALTGIAAVLRLSPREADIAIQIVTGQSDKQIANVLNLSSNTVRTHVTRMYRKLKVKNRTALVTRLDETHDAWRADTQTPSSACHRK